MLVKILSYLSVAYLMAIVFHSALFPDIKLVIIALIFLGISIISSLISRKLIFVAVACLGFGLGIFHFSYSIETSEKYIFDVFVDEEEMIEIEGFIDSYPIVNESYTSFILDVENLYQSENEIAVDSRVLIKTDTYSGYEYGMKVKTVGVLEKPSSFITDTGRIFNYDRYLEKDDVYYTMSFAETSIVDEGRDSIIRSLYRFKKSFLNSIYRIIPSPESGLLAGILFGEEDALGKELEEKFRIVGLMHIVVLSGYNVSIVINIFMRTLVFLPKNIRAIFAVLGIISFALLVGAGPTVVRASIMALFIVLANVLSRPFVIERALFIAGLMMVIMNPKILFFDISFQLSFLATYGLIVLSPWLEEKFKRLPKIFAIQESAVATIAAQIMVLPLLLYQIGDFSIVSPLVNVLVLFAVPWAMLFGFIGSVLYIFLPFLGFPFAFITKILLEYQLLVVELFSQIPFATITVPPFHSIFLFLGYLFIFLWIQKIKNLSKI
ncbi:MAG: ComEC family competence protein [Candidatus Pacebacteria bacterium]|nr:ComEC family competence protein [Candidatus Paceibacterota bacterium]